MSRWSEAIAAHFAAIYALIPDAGCKGLCADACGPIGIHPYERERVGVIIPRPADAVWQLAETGDYTCPALVDGRCSVYEVRPTICRAWGASQDLPCPHGCRPRGGLLSAAQTRRLVEQSRSPARPARDGAGRLPPAGASIPPPTPGGIPKRPW